MGNSLCSAVRWTLSSRPPSTAPSPGVAHRGHGHLVRVGFLREERGDRRFVFPANRKVQRCKAKCDVLIQQRRIVGQERFDALTIVVLHQLLQIILQGHFLRLYVRSAMSTQPSEEERGTKRVTIGTATRCRNGAGSGCGPGCDGHSPMGFGFVSCDAPHRACACDLVNSGA